MPRHSAGLLLFRIRHGATEVLLAHPGGPFWRRRDRAAWSIPKGLAGPNEDLLSAARREFAEEIGSASQGEPFSLGRYVLPGGKRLSVWALEGDFDPAGLVSNLVEMEWPPRSGRRQCFPEVDRAAWFARDEAFVKITKGQKPVLEAFFAGAARGAGASAPAALGVGSKHIDAQNKGR